MKKTFALVAAIIALTVGAVAPVFSYDYLTYKVAGSNIFNLESTGDLTVSGNITSSSTTVTNTATALQFKFSATSSTSTAPSAAGLMVIDSIYDVYVSTDNDSAADWIKVGGQ